MKILLVTTAQFGYLVDYYRYYGYLKKKGHDVHYICIDYGHEKIEKGNPDIHYIESGGNKGLRHLHFINSIKKLDKQHNYDRIMLHVFPMISSLLLLVPRKKMYIDIRTVSIHYKKYKRVFFDSLIKTATKLFKNTSVITDIVAGQLNINNYNLLPVGGAYFSKDETDEAFQQQYRHIFDSGDFVFIYVGTLAKRRIIDCVKGFHAYLKKYPGAKIRFVIIGGSAGREQQEINEYVEQNNLGSNIFTLGYMQQTRLPYFFNNAHCGVSYMPLTMSYSKQPNTKTYEYLVNGLPVLAVESLDNIAVIQSSTVPCGVIIKDNAEGVEYGVEKILNSKDQYSRETISRAFNKYEWDNIFDTYLLKALKLSGS